MEATLKHDPSFLEKYLADDYMAIRNDGKLTTKVQEIENYRSGATKYESIEIREATVRIHGNTAIYNSLNSIKATINGKPFSGDVRNTRVWVKQNGDWKIVAFQATQVASLGLLLPTFECLLARSLDTEVILSIMGRQC
jgi:ketosteroid isomerase-like protein